MSISIIPITVGLILESSLLSKEQSRPVLYANLIQLTIYFSWIVLLGPEYGLIGFVIGFLLSSFVKPIFYQFILKSINYP